MSEPDNVPNKIIQGVINTNEDDNFYIIVDYKTVLEKKSKYESHRKMKATKEIQAYMSPGSTGNILEYKLMKSISAKAHLSHDANQRHQKRVVWCQVVWNNMFT